MRVASREDASEDSLKYELTSERDKREGAERNRERQR